MRVEQKSQNRKIKRRRERHKGLFLSSVLLPVTWTSTHDDSILTILKDRESCQRIYNCVPTLKLFIPLLNHSRRRTRLLYRFVVSFKDEQTFCPSLSVLTKVLSGLQVCFSKWYFSKYLIRDILLAEVSN